MFETWHCATYLTSDDVWNMALCNKSDLSDDVCSMALCNISDLWRCLKHGTVQHIWPLTMFETWHFATCLTSLTMCEACHTVDTLQYISPVWRCIEHFARVYKVWNIVTFDVHLVEQHGVRATSLHTKSKHLGKTCLTPPHSSYVEYFTEVTEDEHITSVYEWCRDFRK